MCALGFIVALAASPQKITNMLLLLVLLQLYPHCTLQRS
jgi:hypothetical protein